ncbi:alcohol dehydrogenase catalytic domain-containing protein [Virgibacillus pantothenticus]|uniref:ribitol-5-phosphate dehydrogenase n=1 Tax=Virgibacillus pantothenticus TaxID=1473 RepID=UPI001C24948A|nr:ribitol-5-phosphate dehydrogenase [Virgibacillus pantothenticus]MBU8566619.1 alcohol dehydrogenase catalytic domain-containing protein [Virgibacillus pantothenticus]MBU8599111.1 alcohol dehydrogenase catalytic domain-containing protein [Virgibacillus pantothenticus]MBU8634776.1 alcohol dehydrogenase catalytic domain-containing protein [Virgibacillus pantothenticus]MBU8641141.1 alcohol dehydrogenase catalytic domain-containing protein [Virgibacillus pantothenticus]MBU8645219.1 alcohol dehydr
MINQVYRLVSPRQFEVTYKDESIVNNHVIVRPTHLSICAADQRYYTGTRGKEAMKKKLPMALTHEGVGEVVFDPSNKFKIGSKVVMVPNTPVESDPYISENYLRSSKFRSSGYDGFMQDYVFLNPDRAVQLPDDINMDVAAFTELMTITVHALRRFKQKAHPCVNTFGVWGDGNLGFITCLFLKKLYPNSRVIIFGKTDYKLNHFSFVDETVKIDDIPKGLSVDHAIECAGGKGSQYAIEQIIDHINPEGTVSLLGVSEYPIEINTRMVLEKGLTLLGSSRSGVTDFEQTVEIFKEHPDIIDYLSTLIGEVFEVRKIRDAIDAFENDLSNSWGKTVMRWKI